MRHKGLIVGGVLIFVVVVALTIIFSAENIQQKAYDMKADLVGTHRIAQVYNEENGLIATYEDEEMRFELVGERSVRIWMGDKNKKVMVINMGVTIADQ